MKKLYLLAPLFITILVSIPANTQTIILNNDTMPKKLLLDSFNGSSRSERIKIAEKLLNNLNELNAVLPELSDISMSNFEKQENYIYHPTGGIVNKNGEFNKNVADQQLKNIKSYYDNPEHNLYELHNEIKLAKASLDCITSSQKIEKEMCCWIITSSLLMDINIWENDINDLIQNHKIDNIDLTGGNTSVRLDILYRIYHGYGQEILLKIVLPYMNQQADNQR